MRALEKNAAFLSAIGRCPLICEGASNTSCNERPSRDVSETSSRTGIDFRGNWHKAGNIDFDHADWAGAVIVMAALYVAAFDAPVLAWRWTSLSRGYEWKERLAVKLKEIPWQAYIRRIRFAGAGLAVAAALLLSLRLAKRASAMPIWRSYLPEVSPA